jgi:hypothetical protein
MRRSSAVSARHARAVIHLCNRNIISPEASSEIAPELTGHGLPLGKCEAYNRVYDQFYQSR